MRRVTVGTALWLSILWLPTACGADSSDAPPAAGKEKAVTAGGDAWQVPAGSAKRFEKDERECTQAAASPRGRRIDRRDIERCLEERGWKRR